MTKRAKIRSLWLYLMNYTSLWSILRTKQLSERLRGKKKKEERNDGSSHKKKKRERKRERESVERLTTVLLFCYKYYKYVILFWSTLIRCFWSMRSWHLHHLYFQILEFVRIERVSVAEVKEEKGVNHEWCKIRMKATKEDIL